VWLKVEAGHQLRQPRASPGPQAIGLEVASADTQQVHMTEARVLQVLQVTFFGKFSNLSNLQYQVNKSPLPSLLL
jgi:hypothetical protein